MTPERPGLIARCARIMEARAAGYLKELESLDEAAAGETKSSAGDKYETGREMIAQSRGLIDRNLAETKAGLDVLERMAKAPLGDKVGLGSLVETSQGWYLVGISMGEVDPESGPESKTEGLDGLIVRTTSLASPLGAVLKGRGAGERIPWRGGWLEILRIDNRPLEA